jgi:8-oxo-dGTP diphosphatase
VEPGEGEAEALRREIREELDCVVSVGELLARTTHRYPDLEVELAFFACVLESGSEPRLVGAAAMEWVEPARLLTLDFCEADLPVLPVLLEAGSRI